MASDYFGRSLADIGSYSGRGLESANRRSLAFKSFTVRAGLTSGR
jgi:hypothetical protein